MLIIRSQQINALLAHQKLQKILHHVRKFFPARCSALEPKDLELTVRSAMERAEDHGFTSLRDALQFVDLSIVFGLGFDHRLHWAREILDGQSVERPHFRCTRLYLRALRQLRGDS